MPVAQKCDCGTCARCKHRIRARAWYWRNRDLACERERARREANVEAVRAFDRARGCRETDQLKRRARNAVAHAIESGALVKEPCEVCGDANVHGHHDDYSKPLDVRWLCPRHHGEEHRRPIPASPAAVAA